MADLTSGTDQLKLDLETLIESETACQEYFDLAEDDLKMYKMFNDVADDWPYPHYVCTPDTFSFVEDATAKLVQSFTGVDPMVAVRKGINSTDRSEKISQQLEIVMAHLFNIEEGDFHYQWENYCRTAAQLGTGYVMVMPIFKKGMFQGDLDYVKFENTDFWNVIPDMRAERLLDCEILFVKRYTNLNALRRLKEGGWPLINLDKVSLFDDKGVVYDTHKLLLQELGLENWEPKEDEVELVYVFTGDGNMRIIANRGVYVYDSSVIDDTPFVYGVPVIDYKFTPQPNEFFGIGIPRMIKDLQYNRNVLRSQRLTNVDMVLSPPMKIKIGSEVDPDQVWSYPGAQIPVGDMDDLGYITYPDVTSGSYREDDSIQMSMEDATSLHRAARGQTETKRQTGTEIIRLQQASLSRYDINIKRGELCLRQIAKRVVAYIHSFMSQESYEAIVGAPDAGFFDTPLEEILRCYKFSPVGASVSSIKEIRAQRSTQAYQLLTSIPPEIMQRNMGGNKPFIIDYYELIKDMLDNMELPNKDRILVLLNQQQQNPTEEGAAELQGELGPLMQQLNLNLPPSQE